MCVKLIQLVLSASLLAACAFQVEGLPTPFFDDITLHLWRPAPTPRSFSPTERSEVCVTQTGVVFKKNDLQLDQSDTGLRPNNRETISRFVTALSGITENSLLGVLGFEGTPPSKRVIYNAIHGLIVGLAQRRINFEMAVIFLEMLRDRADKAVVALKTICSIILNIKYRQATSSIRRRAEDLVPRALDSIYGAGTSHAHYKSPFMRMWSELASYIDQVCTGNPVHEKYGAEKIIKCLAANHVDLERLHNMDPNDQVALVQTIAADIIKYREFLEKVLQRAR